MERKTLKQLRTDIDAIDGELLDLLNRRAGKVAGVAGEKRREGLPVFDPSRETKILERMKRVNKGPLTDRDIDIFMDAIFKIYRSIGRPLTIAYFGPMGTFTHQAAMKAFGEKNEYLACKTVDYVFHEVEKGGADYGVVPIENSSEGIVSHTLDMFVDSELKITAEILLEIHHYLLSTADSLKKVKKVYSHYQPFAQCQQWLEDHLPDAEQIAVDSTTIAAMRAKKEKGTAAIGSEIAGKIYGLKPLAEKIEDMRENITRFLVIGNSCPAPSGNDKTSILFSIKDRIGALHDMLMAFKGRGINLTRIESRPSKKKAWEYVFFVDISGHMDEDRVKDALKELEPNSVFLKILGSYPQAG